MHLNRPSLAERVWIAVTVIAFFVFVFACCSGPASRRVASTLELTYGQSWADGSLDTRFKGDADFDGGGSFAAVSIQPLAGLTMNDEVDAQHKATELAYAHFLEAERAKSAPAHGLESPPPPPARQSMGDGSPAALEGTERTGEVPNSNVLALWITALALVLAALGGTVVWNRWTTSRAVARRMRDGGCS